ncbi:endoglucanase 9-like [Telopea speciosissima]|uniref:endoglucanase 9-like n=1 Tax=Telopea speciosissima TaxID=54955 RepID=UPI001CC6FEDB|nr:endoglucanase 9-like [Telopea speciosissima]
MAPYRAPISKILICAFMIIGVSGHHDYREALSKSIVFFEGQRSGKLPANQRITWRSDTGLSDGSPENVDLSGGYYDAGDNVKFGLPMAFTTTMLSWSVIEFGKRMPNGLHKAREAIRWATDYLLKASSSLPDALYVQVGNPTEDHDCWVRPEDIETPQKVYKVTPTNPGSDVAGETAAALAAASLVFKHVDHQYSKTLLETAKKTFAFADKYKGNYSQHLSSVVCPYYCSYSGYLDELQWGAAWLYKATKNSIYLDYVKRMGVGSDCDTFSWDNKLMGTRVLLSRNSLVEEDEDVSGFREAAERFICNLLPESPSLATTYTPGGLMYKMKDSNLQYVTSTTFLLTSYAKYLKNSTKTFTCGNLVVTPTLIRELTKKQVDYILGDNPHGMSYMVGFGEKFPQRIHHRGSSLSSINEKPQPFGCKEGFSSYFGIEPNPNILTGAIVGGPDQYDNFEDDRDNYAQSEPATYINAPFVGTLAYLASKFKS